MKESVVIVCIVLVFIGLIVLVASATAQRQTWLDEHCTVVGKISGSSSIGTGVSSSGGVTVMPIFTPGKTQYQCDDGIIYTE